MKKYRSISFLVELLINVLVFSISCAILVALFSQAWQITAATREANAAEAEVNTLVEIAKVRGEDGLLQAGGAADGEGRVLFGYGEDWLPAAGGDSPYTVAVQLQPQQSGAGTLYQLTARALADDGKELYTVQTAFYVPD